MPNQHLLTRWPVRSWEGPWAFSYSLPARWIAAGAAWAELMTAGLTTFGLSQWLATEPTGQSAPRYGLRRQDGRFVVADMATGAVVYTPPDFILATDASEFAPLLAALNSGGERIEAVMAYEADAARCSDKNRYLQRYTPSRS